MKYPLFFTLLLFCSNFLTAQNAQLKEIATHQIIFTYQLDLAKDILKLDSTKALPNTENSIITANNSLSDNELVLNYTLKSPGQQGYYIIHLEAYLDNQLIRQSPGYLLGDIGQVNGSTKEERQIIWTNLIADLPETKGLLKLVLKAEQWGISLTYEINCDDPPKFGFKQKAPFYAGWAGGVGGIITGAIFKNKANKNLDRHRAAKTLFEQKEQFDSYTSNLETAQIATYIGVGIIAMDTFFYILRKRAHKKRMQIFEERCSLSVNPFFELQDSKNQYELGLHFSYQF